MCQRCARGRLSAAALRQFSYTTLRLGLYDLLKARYLTGDSQTFVARAATACVAGGVASFFSNPIEVALVRMQSDSRLPLEQRRGYRNGIDALVRIGREEGPRAYFRGVMPTCSRAMVVAMTQIATYDQAKEVWGQLLKLRDGPKLHLVAGVTSGFCYSVVSLPLDTAKTRMQSQTAGPNGRLLYTGLVQTIARVATTEGIASLWRGFQPYFIRSGGHTVFMFLFLEKYKQLVKAYYEG